MTVAELQDLVRVLSNQRHVRWWADYYCDGSTLAISVIDWSGKTVDVPDLESLGFTRSDGLFRVYLIEKTYPTD